MNAAFFTIGQVAENLNSDDEADPVDELGDVTESGSGAGLDVMIPLHSQQPQDAAAAAEESEDAGALDSERRQEALRTRIFTSAAEVATIDEDELQLVEFIESERYDRQDLGESLEEPTHLSFNWFRSTLVRCRSNVSNFSSATGGLAVFLAEGLNTKTAKPFFELLASLEGRCRIGTRMSVTREGITSALSAHQGLQLPTLYVSMHSECFLINHYLDGRRQPDSAARHFGLNHGELLALNCDGDINNLFTALSCLTLGDSSNSVPLRMSAFMHLWKKRGHYREENSNPTYEAALQECLKPCGIVNCVLAQSLAEVTKTPIYVFAGGGGVPDLDLELIEIRREYRPELADSSRQTGHIQDYSPAVALAVYSTPVNTRERRYSTYPVVSRKSVSKVEKAIEERGDGYARYRVICETMEGTVPDFVDIWNAKTALLLELAQDCKFGPQSIQVQPPMFSLAEELREEPVPSPVYDAQDWDDVPEEDKIERGIIWAKRRRQDNFHGPDVVIDVLFDFVRRKQQPQPYPLFPEPKAIFICAADERPEGAHGAMSSSHRDVRYYSQDG